MRPRSSAETRRLFLEYFRERGHQVVPSSPLVPEGDPTLLFTNAGMVQFKNLFLGLEKRPYVRATSVQKCLRVSGKHNDLEQVGPSPRHHTFFEMLGNFSFGDYFKREAIAYAWEFLTEVLGMPKDRFHFTVYKDDEESFQLWQELAGAPPEKIHRMGEKSNFWMMGDVGPCGPNTELVFDRGREHCTCGRADCSPALDNDCDRWWEVWNLVFMQFEQRPDGSRIALQRPGVDTGMGFERLVAILQGAETNYDTDLFQPIMRKIAALLGHDEAEMREGAKLVAYRVLADHSRAVAFLLADGVLPGNEGRSYVTRMIVRRAIRFGKRLGFTGPFLGELVKVVIELMGEHYTELVERKDFILRAIRQEEEQFERTLSAGLERLEALIAQLKSERRTEVPGAEVFRLYDTYGFPPDLTKDVATEHGLVIDRSGFEREMERQKERSASRKAVISGFARVADEIISEMPSFEAAFLGYRPGSERRLEAEEELFDAVILEGSKLTEVQALTEGAEGYFLFKESPFYAEGGGQVGDRGWITNLSRHGKAEVLDVERDRAGVALHKVRVLEGEFVRGDRCRLEVDATRRKKIMRHHTATHLLHASLRKVLGYKQGIQAGSLVAPEELRFDFTHLAPLAQEELSEVERLVNEAVLADLPVTITYETLEEAKAKGAMALFAEDYQGKEKVRVVTTGEPGSPFSIELCGGTHVRRTGEIGLIKIIAEEGIAAGVRRIRAVAGTEALRLLTEQAAALKQASALLKASERELLPRLEGLLKERAELESSLAALRTELLSYRLEELLRGAESLDGAKLVAVQVELGAEELKQLADLLEARLERGVVLLGSAERSVPRGRAVLVCKVSDALTKRFHAGEIIREVAKVVGGNGGGSPRFAQGGGPQPEKLAQALEEGIKLIKSRA
ncbi:MAG: alanine--tRNA ligase [Candidatus Acetothermia bacterium]|jgi:alanyl-tRNA synthetase|nr:alanine--tRNA ligase [Candidatus Acetothermia bacterium]MDH7504907.1 alanine--tRNA ligase [Candidatus Acetothermia bacterium]